MLLDIEIPDPALVLFIGPSGSGKSTFAAKHFPDDAIVSSDRVRALLTGTEDFDESSLRKVFDTFHQMIEDRMQARQTAVADATGLLRLARVPLMEMAWRAGLPVVAILFDIDRETCLARDASRTRRVGAKVLDRQFREFSVARQAVQFEPHQHVYFLDRQSQAAAAVRRVPAPAHVHRGLHTPLPVGSLRSAPERPPRSLAPMDDIPAVHTGHGAPGVAAHLHSLRTLTLFRALPPGERAMVVAYRDAENAAKNGAPPDRLSAAPGAPAAAMANGFPAKLERVRQDLINSGFWSRRHCAVFAMDCQLAAHPDGTRIVPIGPAIPPPVADTKHHDHFWDWLEIDAISLDFSPAMSLLFAPSRGNHADASEWIAARIGEGLEVVEVRHGEVIPRRILPAAARRPSGAAIPTPIA